MWFFCCCCFCDAVLCSLLLLRVENIVHAAQLILRRWVLSCSDTIAYELDGCVFLVCTCLLCHRFNCKVVQALYPFFVLLLSAMYHPFSFSTEYTQTLTHTWPSTVILSSFDVNLSFPCFRRAASRSLGLFVAFTAMSATYTNIQTVPPFGQGMAANPGSVWGLWFNYATERV